MAMPDLTVTGLRDWLRAQEPETRYDYEDVEACLCARFVKGQGFEAVVGGSMLDLYSTPSGPRQLPVSIPLPAALDEIGRGCSRDEELDASTWTYGAALARCEERLR